MPSLKATPREIGSVTILDLSGPIPLGESSALFGKAIRELTNNDRTKIILNLRDVSSVDSAEIDITRLLRVLDVFTDEALALRSFG